MDLGLDKKPWLNALKRVARKVDSSDETSIRFSENGILTLFKHFTTLLKESNITGLRFQILDDFGSGLYQLYLWLLKTPTDLTGKEFDIHARCLLGFQFVQIFGTGSVTATIKQIAVYTGYYIDQAREDGVLSGQPLTLRNFSDALMETAHKSTKLGSISYGRGKKGPSTEKDYQESILAQQMANCALHISSREAILATSSSAKVKRLQLKDHSKEVSKVNTYAILAIITSRKHMPLSFLKGLSHRCFCFGVNSLVKSKQRAFSYAQNSLRILQGEQNYM